MHYAESVEAEPQVLEGGSGRMRPSEVAGAIEGSKGPNGKAKMGLNPVQHCGIFPLCAIKLKLTH